jgi:hypothetical protein
MSLTAYHAKLFAHELTKRSSSDNVDKLASALSDAQVDLNPHQIEAALFAFRLSAQPTSESSGARNYSTSFSFRV